MELITPNQLKGEYPVGLMFEGWLHIIVTGMNMDIMYGSNSTKQSFDSCIVKTSD